MTYTDDIYSSLIQEVLTLTIADSLAILYLLILTAGCYYTEAVNDGHNTCHKIMTKNDD